MGHSTCGTVMMVMATILGPVVIVFLAVSFATDRWLEFNVDRSKLTSATTNDNRVTHTRYRGLFRECYPGNDTAFLETAVGVVDNYCFNVEYDFPESTNNLSDEYLARIHLSRCFLAFYILALTVYLVAFIFGMVLCCIRKSKWAYIAGLCAYIAAFSTAAAIAFFHGAEYLERNKISDDDTYYLRWTAELQNATSRKYGYSYILGWVGMILAALAATFYSVAGCYIGSERYEDREYLEKRPTYYMETPMGPDPYGPRGYPAGPMVGPYVYDFETRRQLPAIGYQEPYVSWS